MSALDHLQGEQLRLSFQSPTYGHPATTFGSDSYDSIMMPWNHGMQKDVMERRYEYLRDEPQHAEGFAAAKAALAAKVMVGGALD